MRWFFPLFLYLTTTSLVQGIPLYRMYTQGCAYKEGAIVDIHQGQMSLLGLDGRVSTLAAHEVRLIAVYESLENPFRQIHGATLYRIQAQSVYGQLDAIAVGFAEDVILFLDTQSHSVAIGFNEFRSLNSLKNQSVKFSAFRQIELQPPRLDQACVNSPPARLGQAIAAQSVLAGDFVIQAFIDHQEAGFAKLEGLVERSLFYPRPLMFDTKNRLGLSYFKNDYYQKLGYEKPVLIPLFFQSGSGDPYRFQGEYGFGFMPIPQSPTIFPDLYAFSKFKSHILHGEIVLNLNGAAAGKKIHGDYDYVLYEESKRKNLYQTSSFNHLTLLGLDYSQYSVSFGSIIKTYLIQSGEDLRELTFGKPSPVFRVAYTTPYTRLETLLHFDRTRAEMSDAEIDRITSWEDGGPFQSQSKFYRPAQMRVDSKLIRVNAVQKIYDFQLKLSIIQEITQIQENAYGWSEADGVEYDLGKTTNRYDGTQTTFHAGYQQDLGEWIGLRADIMINRGEFESSFAAHPYLSRSKKAEGLSYAVGLDLLL